MSDQTKQGQRSCYLVLIERDRSIRT